MAKDCWFKDTSKGKRQRQRQKEEQCERSRNSDRVDDDSGGNATSQISRITQDDTWDRPVTMDEDEDEGYETGYILAAIPTQGNIHTVQRLVCCARIGGQLRGWACVLSMRL